jgi:transposase
MEQRVNIKFCVNLGKMPTETYEMLQAIYGDEAVSRSNVSEWFRRFKDGREDLQYDPRSGRPSTSRNADTIANVRKMVIRGSRLTLRIMSDELNIHYYASSLQRLYHY